MILTNMIPDKEIIWSHTIQSAIVGPGTST